MGAGRTRTALNDHALSSFYRPNPMVLAGRTFTALKDPLLPKLHIQILCLTRSPCPKRYRNLLPRPFSTRSYRRYDARLGTTMPVLRAGGLAKVWAFFFIFVHILRPSGQIELVPGLTSFGVYWRVKSWSMNSSVSIQVSLVFYLSALQFTCQICV